ncbi:YolD-like family protein (plasmid) [Paenibacillus rhizovicinus]|uniref:YolD-like family protein n=1 Tax=Paenibacillus rhizovicinus TaxID=2704463 RepID=A0A6C0PCZ5_9BACL|nr:YolD-like family protein [Paenibacillus rhizovicinus]QHW35822.1 YolD-like family protein [Paenibacillus rhizovicinus]
MSKLDGNGVWSSKFIVPEFGAALAKHQLESRRRAKPLLDDQEWEIITQAIGTSRFNREPVKLILFDPFEDVSIEGVVEKFDPQLQQIRMNSSWFKLADVIGVG